MAENAVEADALQGVRSSIQVIDRSVALLTVIAGAGASGIALKNLTAAVGLRPSTARTLLSALVAHGLVRQAPGTRYYLLGPTFFNLNRAYAARSDLASVAAPVIEDLWKQTKETVHLSVLKGDRRVDLAVLVSPQLLNINPTSGHFEDELPTPPYLTAAGKVLFAGCTREQRADMLERAPWRKLPASTKLSAADVQRLAEEVAAAGYATNYEEEAPGVCGVAAPVIDHSGRTVAALCIGYPSVRHTPEYDQTMREAAVAAAQYLSSLLGARSGASPT